MMPMTVYLDGSGTHDDSEILTLSACGIADHLIEPFSRRWQETLREHGLECLHMREVNGFPDERRIPIERDIFRLLGDFSQEFFYNLICSVNLADHAAAKTSESSLKPAQELCVDHCVGGIAIPTEDLGRRDTVRILFDRNETFRRHMQPFYDQSSRREGWPRQVRHPIQTIRSCDEPGMQVADLFGWAMNRHLRCTDKPEYALALTGMRYRACLYDGNPNFRAKILILRWGKPSLLE
jgi:hypothetical protein